ncbi:hypothetical protein ACXDF8_12375 [Mycolicibacterium sp. CBM1]
MVDARLNGFIGGRVVCDLLIFHQDAQVWVPIDASARAAFDPLSAQRGSRVHAVDGDAVMPDVDHVVNCRNGASRNAAEDDFDLGQRLSTATQQPLGTLAEAGHSRPGWRAGCCTSSTSATRIRRPARGVPPQGTGGDADQTASPAGQVGCTTSGEARRADGARHPLVGWRRRHRIRAHRPVSLPR